MCAQENNDSSNDFFKGWRFGLKAGVNFSTMFGDVGDNSFLFFPHAGAVADKDITEVVTLSTEPHFSGEGQNLNGGYERVIFFNIPVLVKYNASPELSIDGGLHTGIKIAETTKFGQSGEKRNRNRYKRIAPGITGGATYAIDGNWFTQVRANLKLSDVIRADAGDTEGSTILTLQLSVGYWLD
ncbi:MAG: outer membrane beta-barrel protein [Bacteroidota bacterium]